MRQFAIKPRRRGVLPARAGRTHARVDVSEACAASAITAEPTATAEVSSVLGKVPRRLHSSQSGFFCPSRDGPPCAAARNQHDEGLSRATLAHDPAGCQSQMRLRSQHITRDRSARPELAVHSVVNLAPVTPARPSRARCVVTSPGRAHARPGATRKSVATRDRTVLIDRLRGAPPILHFRFLSIPIHPA